MKKTFPTRLTAMEFVLGFAPAVIEKAGTHVAVLGRITSQFLIQQGSLMGGPQDLLLVIQRASMTRLLSDHQIASSSSKA